ncbi:hypothetical protein L596_005883 [Steinernema carpocapsae]|uniref:SP-RING-type domain-containing protein n=1 Tax=Steinernema carpocapsae TaxID=34508 RepID=A0A4V6I8L6_STECR|nr:hypothetical protein L596_005883 [Steinernema carpocapsae]
MTRQKPRSLPFHKVLKKLLDYQQLPALKRGAPYRGTVTHEFEVDEDVLKALAFQDNTTVIPRTEILLRFFSATDWSSNMRDFNPLNHNITLNGRIIKHTQWQGNFDPNRQISLPIDLTSFVKTSTTKNKIEISWKQTRQAYNFAIFLCEKVAWKNVYIKTVSKRNRYRAANDTEEEIRWHWTKKDGVQITSLRASLLCPISLKHMKRPVKGLGCAHLQCFDLKNFLMMNDKRPTLKCPICAKSIFLKEIMIDTYFAKILTDTKSSLPRVNDVEIAEDGSYTPVYEKPQARSKKKMREDDFDEDVIFIM